jgi:iron complex outermembrane recepter protein
VADLSLGARLARGGRIHALSLRVENVTDVEYRDHLARTKEIMPQPGRGVSLLYRLTY